jgi:Heterokaryon incompatibility protein (HET)
MRLLDSKTLELKEFPENEIPKYAILSHTWGEHEISFYDMKQGSADAKAGYTKIEFSRAQAVADGLDYFWVDTCCIDKSSSAELSEAINSMYRWYQNAQICYAYLADVTADEEPQAAESAFAKSRWFTRGWTLQELIAPSNLVFYSTDWRKIATKSELRGMISQITGIEVAVLEGTDPDCFSIAQRMSWASKRSTTRIEDIAYCLLGIFGVNMALLYGEGERSFVRLQEEIMKVSDDHSLFAWKAKDSDPRTSRGLLATSPEEFQDAGRIASYHDWTLNSLPYAMTNKGLRITLSLYQTKEQNVYIATLNCLATNYGNESVAIFLKKLSSVGDQYVRVRLSEFTTFRGYRNNFMDTIYVRQKMPVPEPESFHQQQQVLNVQFSSSIGAYVLSKIDTPTGSMPVEGLIFGKQLPIPEGSNGWIAALWFKHRDPKNTEGFCVLLGFTPDFGVSIRIVLKVENQDSRYLFRRYDPREPSVLEHFIVNTSGPAARRRLYIDLGLQRHSGSKTYLVKIGMEHYV